MSFCLPCVQWDTVASISSGLYTGKPGFRETLSCEKVGRSFQTIPSVPQASQEEAISSLGSYLCPDLLPADHSSMGFLVCHPVYMITRALDLANLLIELPEEKANIGTCAIHTHVHKSICIHTHPNTHTHKPRPGVTESMHLHMARSMSV